MDMQINNEKLASTMDKVKAEALEVSKDRTFLSGAAATLAVASLLSGGVLGFAGLTAASYWLKSTKDKPMWGEAAQDATASKKSSYWYGAFAAATGTAVLGMSLAGTALFGAGAYIHRNRVKEAAVPQGPSL